MKRHYVDPDYGPYLGHPMDPRTPEPPECECEYCAANECHCDECPKCVERMERAKAEYEMEIWESHHEE